MASTTLHIRIKKKYAAAIIKDLEKIDAVELLEEPPVPGWQQKEVKKRLKNLKKDSSTAVSWVDGMKKIKQLAK